MVRHVGGRLPRVEAGRKLALLAISMALFAACTPGVQPHRGEAEGSPSLWPTEVDEIAVLRRGAALSLTDGNAVAPLKIGDAGSADGSGVAVASLGPTRLALLAGSPGAAIHVVDLDDGDVVSRPCLGCSGFAGIDGHAVTVLADGTLVVFDENLSSASTAPLSGVAQPTSSEWLPYPDWDPAFLVLGSVSDTVLLGRLAPDGIVRGGPTLVSRHSLDGSHLDEVSLEGRAAIAQADASGEQVVVATTHSSGACSSGALLQTLDGDAVRTEASEILEDWSWAGESLLTVSYTNQMTAEAGCDLQPREIRELSLGGRANDAFDSPGITRFRALGRCDRVIALIVIPGELPVVRAADRGSRRDLGQFDDIAWSAPSASRCGDVGQLLETLADV